MKFIFLVGLPGSGKTYMGRQMGEHFLDDICRTCGTERLKESFTSETVIVADPSLCRSVNRFFAEKMLQAHHPGCEIEWVFFENNPDKCWANVQARNDGRTISKRMIYDLSKQYKMPEDATIIEVWQG
jgi:hypothetical protein